MKRFFKYFFEKQLRYNSFFYQRLKAVQNLEKLDSSELKIRKERKFLHQFKKAYQQSPFYADLYRKYGIKDNHIQSIDDLQTLPVIEKQDILNLQNKIFVGRGWNKFMAKSSGTSGASLTVFRDYQAVIEEGAYQWAHRIKFGHYPGMKTVVLRGNLNFKEKEKYDPFTKTLYLSSFRLNEENAEWYYQRIKDFAPNAIFAYPSSLESLANFFRKMYKSLVIPVIFTSSETLYSYQREKIEAVFSSRIIDWYGNAERTIALQEQEDGYYEQVPLYSINEFKSDHMITTSLINNSFPLIRYKVDDVIHLGGGSSSAGHRIREIQGRSDDLIILADGTRIGLICNAFDGINHLLLSQVIQEVDRNIIVKLVVSPDYSHEDEEKLKLQMTENIGRNTPFTLRYVNKNEIGKSKSGKFKLLVNKLQEQNKSLLATSVLN